MYVMDSFSCTARRKFGLQSTFLSSGGKHYCWSLHGLCTLTWISWSTSLISTDWLASSVSAGVVGSHLKFAFKMSLIFDWFGLIICSTRNPTASLWPNVYIPMATCTHTLEHTQITTALIRMNAACSCSGHVQLVILNGPCRVVWRPRVLIAIGWQFSSPATLKNKSTSGRFCFWLAPEGALTKDQPLVCAKRCKLGHLWADEQKMSHVWTNLPWIVSRDWKSFS